VGKSNELAQNVSKGSLSAVLGIEGGHALEGKIERVKEVYARGCRFIGLTHLYNNELGGSSSPLQGNKPLTELGRQMLDEMHKLGMVLDVSHASPKTLEQMLEHPVRPFCSHAGVSKERKLWRNLDDASLKKIADKGGVVGIIFATYYVGGKTLDDIARHIQHAVNVMGEDGVGLGSDFDGLIPLPQGIKDVADLPNLTEALLRRGMPVRLVEKVVGENFKRFFLEVLERS
jgi:membrane dipeptidase